MPKLTRLPASRPDKHRSVVGCHWRVTTRTSQLGGPIFHSVVASRSLVRSKETFKQFHRKRSLTGKLFTPRLPSVPSMKKVLPGNPVDWPVVIGKVLLSCKIRQGTEKTRSQGVALPTKPHNWAIGAKWASIMSKYFITVVIVRQSSPSGPEGVLRNCSSLLRTNWFRGLGGLNEKHPNSHSDSLNATRPVLPGRQVLQSNVDTNWWW